MIKLWALIYRLTGWYSPFARAAEYDAVMFWIIKEDYDVSGEEISMFIGMWRAHHGFDNRIKVEGR